VVTAAPANPAVELPRTTIRRARIVDSFRELCQERAHIPPLVVDALRAIEALDGHDMYDREAVLRCAPCHGYEAAGSWLASHRHLYFAALRMAHA
jgi:hypothetical protein